MSNAILLNWSNFATAVSALPKAQQPIQQKQLQEKLGKLLDWYRTFTDIPAKQLGQVEKQFGALLKRQRKENRQAMRGAVYSAVEFLRSYLEPAEIVNMSQFGADGNESKALAKMTRKMGGFHAAEFGKLDCPLD